ncbi:MAG: hypothetical protein RIT04_317 [Candidatus Parcubacteria bacterium]|jgi:glycosyltransferase involved in cell wall biosynthesis
MKIAIFHSFMDNIGGAEIVALILARELNASIYTTNIDEEKIQKMGFADVLPRIKSIGRVPRNAPFRHQLTVWKFRRLNLARQYDFYIIAGDWAMSAAVHNRPNLWYVHSPLNELWHWNKYVRTELVSPYKRPLFDVWVQFNRMLSRHYAKYVDMWVSNSENTKNRVKKYYFKEATVIHPPTYTSQYSSGATGDYWLSVNRLLNHKRIDVQLRAFSKLPDKKLIIVGSYEKGSSQFEAYKKYLEEIMPNNVEILNWVDDVKLKELYSNCRGFITTARDEDFGMTVVEAMASGKPVIAPNEGGYRESVINDVTGILIDDIRGDALVSAVEKIEHNLKANPRFYDQKCIERAREFDTQVFVKKIKEQIHIHQE